MSTRSVGPISSASVRAELWQLALIVVAVLTIVLVLLPLTPANDPPRSSFLLLALASWALAPSHGITIHVQPSQAVASHGAWLALAITLTVCGYAMRRRLGPVDLTG
jgi:hypothetical protein